MDRGTVKAGQGGHPHSRSDFGPQSRHVSLPRDLDLTGEAGLSLTLVFRVFAALLGLFGMVNVLLVILAEPIGRFSPVLLAPTISLTDAILLFGVGAGVWALTTPARKAH